MTNQPMETIHILYLEDNPDDVSLIQTILKHSGLSCDILWVDRKEKFEAAILNPELDIIIGDYKLPNYNGLVALRYVKEKRPDLPFILLSGTIGEEKTIEMFRAGVADFILKENLHRLEPAITRALNEIEEKKKLKITEEKLKENELKSLMIIHDLAEMKKLDKLKNEFLSVVSHELRTPLTSIQGALDLLTSGVLGELSAHEPQELLILAKQNSERLIRLINDILDVEKMESGKMEFLFKPVEITRLLKEVINANQSYAESFNVRIKLLPPEQNIIVQADYDRLIQVLSNLISNAIKFSPRGGEVALTANQQGDKVRISVTDNGLGIPEEFQSKIFQKFSQADSSASCEHSGTGLGLSISRTIVEKHNGTISFITKINEGTTFYFYLPIIAVTKSVVI